MVVPWSPSVPLRITLSPAAARAAEMRTADSMMPIPDVLMKILSALPLLHDLGVAGNDRDARLMRRRAHRLEDASQILDRESLFENEAGGEIERTRAAHREVVDRAVDGEPSDVAAGKENRGRPHKSRS